MQHDPLVIFMLVLIVFYVSTANDKTPKTKAGWVFHIGYRVVMIAWLITSYIEFIRS